MAGSSSITANQTVTFTDNMSFDGTDRGGAMTTNGQLWIGATASNRANDGGHVRLGSITSPLGTLAIGYSAPNITLDLTGGSVGIDSVAVQTGSSPVVPTAAGLITFNGAVVAAGTNPVRTDGTGVNTYALEVQTSQALAAADATKIGLSNFDSSSFTVAATGFVTLLSTGAGKTITGDSGGALSPIANNWNIVGLSGSKTSGATNVLTIKSPPFSQIGSTATSTLNTGEFVTAAVTRTLPASAGLIDGDLLIFVVTSAAALTIQSVSAQKIRLGNVISAAAGTAVSTQIGDSLTLRFNATDGFWYAVSSIGSWTIT